MLSQYVRQLMANPAAGGVVLVVMTVVALVWANSPFQEAYTQLWHWVLPVRVGPLALERDLHFWVNDLLMAVFFLAVGLEIRRETQSGHLASLRQASLPVLAAAGGMLGPAVIYLLWNGGNPSALSGWGIPTATDIAFALGILALLGSRVPLGLKIFLAALAIADDLGAILVIALFYSDGVVGSYVAAMAVVMLALVAVGRLRVARRVCYLGLALCLWWMTLLSGLHPTIAGVLLAFVTPVAWQHTLEHRLQPWVAWVILPLFALANAGVSLSADVLGGAATSPIAWGVTTGLLLGKPLGVMGAAALAVKLGWSALPAGVRWLHVFGVSILAGIGFTMSIFIAMLAFDGPVEQQYAKLGILLASMVAAIGGTLVLDRTLKREDTAESPRQDSVESLPAGSSVPGA